MKQPQSSPGSQPPDAAPSVRDLLCGLAVGILSLALYVSTLQPDLGGPEDTPKFQFLGHVLGTAHPPGYPLYVVLSHVFVQLPLGTLAYRANLFSAVMAATACTLAYLIGRQIRAGRWAAAAAALALGTGASFWRSAVFAEVYSLAAVMAALTIGLLLAWGARGGAGGLLGAVAAFAAGLGNHLTIVGLFPAASVYVLLRNRRTLTPRLVGAAGILLSLGLLQYGFIILRTHQGAAYLESQARSVRELVAVVTAERFAGQRFAFGPYALLTEQIPATASVVGSEFGLAGGLMVAAGLLAAIQTRSSGAALLLGAAAGMLGMIVNLSGDVHGFVTPVLVLLWPLAGLGVDAVGRLAGPRRAARTVILAGAAAVPLANLAANYASADQSAHTADAEFLRSVYAQVPDRAAIVAEDYWIDMALHYLALSGEGGPPRDVARVGFDAAAVREAARTGRRVFAFAGAATFLSAEGMRFDRSTLVGPTLAEWLGRLRRGTVVVGATAFTPVPIELAGLDSERARGRGRDRAFTAFVLIVGKPGSGWREDDHATSLVVDHTAGLSTVPALAGELRAAADPRGARIVLGAHPIAEVDSGLALAAFAPDGRLLRAVDLPTGEPRLVPFEGALYELAGETPCVNLMADAWTDAAPALVTGGWVATLPVRGSVVVESEVRSQTPRVSELLGGGSAHLAGATTSGTTDRIRTELTRTGSLRPLFRVALDGYPAQARARLEPGGASPSLSLCAHHSLSLFRGGRRSAVLKPDFESEAYFGAGWGDAELTPAGRLRRAAERATLFLPLEPRHSYAISLYLGGEPRTRTVLAFNGRDLATCELDVGSVCELTVPAAALNENGLNTLVLSQPGSRLTFYRARVARQ
jgi:hypothetical protein